MAQKLQFTSTASPPARSPSATESDDNHAALHFSDQQSDICAKALPKGFELTLPLGRVKKIIKQDPDVKAVSNDANYAIAKAAEVMLDELVERAAQNMLAEERILLAYSDVATAVKETESLQFLTDVVPRKMQAEALLQHLQRFHNR